MRLSTIRGICYYIFISFQISIISPYLNKIVELAIPTHP
jgi:hypothetical protein